MRGACRYLQGSETVWTGWKWPILGPVHVGDGERPSQADSKLEERSSLYSVESPSSADGNAPKPPDHDHDHDFGGGHKYLGGELEWLD